MGAESVVAGLVGVVEAVEDVVDLRAVVGAMASRYARGSAELVTSKVLALLADLRGSPRHRSCARPLPAVLEPARLSAGQGEASGFQ